MVYEVFSSIPLPRSGLKKTLGFRHLGRWIVRRCAVRILDLFRPAGISLPDLHTISDRSHDPSKPAVCP